MRRATVWTAGLLWASAALAQTGPGALTGSVTDPARGPVARARVVLIHAASGARRQTWTSAAGSYAFTSLEDGAYQMTVRSPGYERFVQDGLRIAAGRTVRLDVLLQSGLRGETTGSGFEEPLLATEGAEISTAIPAEYAEALPLAMPNVRNALAFAILAPGVTGVAGVPGNSSLRVNGSPAATYRVLVDGQDVTNPVDPSLTLEQQPSIQALAELSIHSGSLAAQSGQSAGGLLRLRTQPGDYRFHGAVAAYIRNEALNAGRPFSDDGAGRHLRPDDRDRNFAGAIGGPVVIPRLYDGRNGTYFHLSVEAAFNRGNKRGDYITVPTAAYREGDFSAALGTRSLGQDLLGRGLLSNTIYDPLSSRSAAGRIVRDPFPLNRIDPSRFDPVAVRLQNLIPRPDPGRVTAAGAPMLTNNFEARHPIRQDRQIPSLRIDHELGGEGRFSAYASLYRMDGTAYQDGLPEPITAAAGRRLMAWTFNLTGDYAVTPSLVAHLGLGYMRSRDLESPVGGVLQYPTADPVRGLGLAGGLAPGMPAITIGVGAERRGGVSPDLGARHGASQFGDKATATASLTRATGGHTYQVGGEARQDVWAKRDNLAPLGTWTFGAAQTALPYLAATGVAGSDIGFPYASFLLGYAGSASVGNVTDPRFMKRSLAVYWQDVWKAAPGLTLDYGLRWSSQQPPHETRYRTSMFSPTEPNPSAGGLPGGMVYEGFGPGRCNCGFGGRYLYAIGPRLGLAWQMTPGFVLRAGWGVSYGTANYFGNATGGIGLGWNTADFGSTAFGEPAAALRTGLSYDAEELYRVNLSAGLRPSPGQINSPPFFQDRNSGRPPRVNQFNVSLQREIVRDLVIEAAYVGNRSVWNQANSLTGWNALTPERLNAFGLDISRAADRDLLISPLNSPLAAARGFGRAPYAGFPAGLTVAQSLRPFPQFGDIAVRWAPLGNTWYDAFQARLVKRFSGGFGFTAAFTRQKELTLGVEDQSGSSSAVNDVFNRGKQKGLFPQSRPLVLAASFSYSTPGAGPYRVIRFLAGGWTVAGMLRYQSGPLIRIPGARNNLEQLLFRGSFANRVEGAPLFLADAGGRLDPNRERVLNPGAWSGPAPGQWGLSAVYFNDYRGRRSPEESVSVGKLFRLREGVSLAVRAESYNVLNRTVLPAPESSNALAPEFGLIDTTAGVDGSRRVQLTARFRF